jgi:hypothetical protein
MPTPFEASLPSDIHLLLRADAEQHWLNREVIPVLRDIEADGQLPEEEVSAALAYLEAMWDEATLRAQETDAAHNHLRSREQENATLRGPASRYHAAVRVLRAIVAKRVTRFVERAPERDKHRRETRDHADPRADELRLKDARPGGCSPRTAL